MGYDGGYYMMGGMHGLWWLFWVVLLGVLVFSGWGRARDWRNRSGEAPRDRGLGSNGTVTALKDRVSGRVTGETHRDRQCQAKQLSSARAC